MRIEGPRPTPPASSTRRAAKADGGFQTSDAEAPARATQPAPAMAAPSLDALLALQGREGEPQERRRRQVSRGNSALDAMDALRLATLDGRGGGAARAALSAWRAGREATGDAGLDSVLDAIEVRAAVELAKWERSAV